MPEPIAEPVVTPTSVVNADGSFVENWHEKYGKENKAHLERYKNFDDFVNSHVSQRKKFSKDPDTLVEIPTEHSSDETRAAFYKARGVPDAPEGYEYKLPDELAVKLGPVEEEKMGAWRKFAHEKLHLSPSEFKGALDFYHNGISADIDTERGAFDEQRAAKIAEGKAELKKDWLGDTDRRTQRAQSVMEKYGGVDAVKELDLQNSPTLVKFLDRIAEAMSEDTLKGLVPVSGLTKDNLKTQIADIRSEMDTIMKENPSNYKGNVKFRDLQARKTTLYKQFPA